MYRYVDLPPDFELPEDGQVDHKGRQVIVRTVKQPSGGVSYLTVMMGFIFVAGGMIGGFLLLKDQVMNYLRAQFEEERRLRKAAGKPMDEEDAVMLDNLRKFEP